MTPSRRFQLLCALLLGGLLAACGGPGKPVRPTADEEPAWVLRPESHPGARGGEYLVALGSASGRGAAARESAYRKGLQEVAASILVDVKSTVVSSTTSLLTKSQANWSERLVEDIRLGAEAELPGAETLDTFEQSSPAATILLVGVPRRELVDLWLPQLDAALGSARELARAAETEASGDVPRRLLALAQAQAVVADTWILANKLRVVATRTPQAPRVAASWNEIAGLMTSLSSDVTQLASQVRLSTVRGDGQEGRVRGRLAKSLVVRAEHVAPDGTVRPIAGLPLRFTPAHRRLAELHADGAVTGDDGLLAAEALNLNRAGDAPLEIHVRPDLGEGLPAPPGLPEAVFRFSLPTPADTRIVLVLREHLDGRALSTAALAPALAGHLGEAGFDVQVVDGSSSAGARLIDAAPADVGPLVERDVDYVLRGEALVRHTGPSSGLHWFHARGRLELVDLADDSVLPLTSDEVKDAHSTAGEEGVHRVVRRRLLPVLGALLDEHFVSSFTSAPERDG